MLISKIKSKTQKGHKPHHRHGVTEQADHREREIIRNRMVMVPITLVACILLEADPNIIMGFVLYQILTLTVALAYRMDPRPNNLRRLAGISLEFGFGIYFSYIGGGSVAAFYPLYLWTILGYGFRFGLRWLFTATILGSLSFGWTVYNIPFWYEKPSLSIGLLVGLIAVPIYCSTLITKLSHAKEEAEKANRAKSLFLASISHELRTPLNAIIGYGTHLLEMDMPKAQSQMVGTSVSAGRHLLHLINQLLSFAKSESIEDLPDPTEFRATELLTEVRDILQIAADEKGINLHLQAEAMSDKVITGQEDYIKNIMINLASNAVKFTDQGSVILKCGLTEDNGQSNLWCSVTDTGLGIAKDAQEKIFGVFQQADDSVVGKFGGTGLGLAICRQLAEQMGGTVGVESEIGSGSTFTFRCPISSFEDEAQEDDQEVVRLLSLGLGDIPPVISGEQDDQIQIDHICCEENQDIDAILKDVDLAAYDIAVIDAELSDRHIENSKLWESFAENQLPPVLLSKTDTRRLDEIKLRAAFASVLPSTPDFDMLRSVIRIGCSFQAEAETSTEDKRNSPVERQPHKILVADDNRTNQMVLETILSNAGHDVVVVGDGDEALEALENQPFDIVFLDVNMPKMGGIECAKMWRQIEGPRNHTPIIALTADATEETEKRCLNAGMDLRLTKPIESKALLDAVTRHADSQESVAEATPQLDPFNIVQTIKGDDQTVEQAPVDKEQLDYLASIGDQDFVQSIIDAYLDDAAEIMTAFENAVQNSELEDFRFHAHAFKSGANNIGAKRLSEMCGKLEVISEGEFIEKRLDYFEQIRSEVERVSEHLKSLHQQQSNTDDDGLSASA